MTPAFKIFYKIHVYLGIFVALHLIVLTVSGSVLLFKDEIESLGGAPSENYSLPDSSAKPLINDFFQNILKKYPNTRPLAYSLEEEAPHIAQVRLAPNNGKEFRGSLRVYFNTFTGEEVAAPKKPNSFMDWLLRLHREFLLGSNGKIYVAFIGLLYAFSLISGFFIYGNFSKKTSYGDIRQGSTRTGSSDLHRFLGVTTFAWGLLIGVTGLFLGLNSTLINLYQYAEIKKISAQYKAPAPSQLPSLDKVLASAQAALPQSSFDFMAFPDTQFSPPNSFLVLMHGNTAWTEKLVELVVVDATTGDFVEVRTLPWYLKFTMLSEPLHFGNYGGLTLKILWLILSLISLALPVLGIYIWYTRKFKKAARSQEKKTLRLSNSPLFARPYFLPVIVAVATLVGILGSFLDPGPLKYFYGLLLLIPIYFCLRHWVRSRSDEKP